SEAKKQQAAGIVAAQVKLQIAVGIKASETAGGFVKSRAVFTLTNRNLIKVIAATILQNQRTAKAASAIRFRNRLKGYQLTFRSRRGEAQCVRRICPFTGRG